MGNFQSSTSTNEQEKKQCEPNHELVSRYCDLTDEQKTKVVNTLKTFIKECSENGDLIGKKFPVPKSIYLSNNKYFWITPAVSWPIIDIDNYGTRTSTKVPNESLDEMLKILTDEIAKNVNFSSYTINFNSCTTGMKYNDLPSSLKYVGEYSYVHNHKDMFYTVTFVVTNVFNSTSVLKKVTTTPSAPLKEAVDEPI